MTRIKEVTGCSHCRMAIQIDRQIITTRERDRRGATNARKEVEKRCVGLPVLTWMMSIGN